ncbi:MAG: hypothetical protein AB7Q37_09725 [Pyrinomonadaceae bacterium]
MPREPKTSENQKTEPPARQDDEPTEPEARSYYYDDAHGYEDYEPDNGDDLPDPDEKKPDRNRDPASIDS